MSKEKYVTNNILERYKDLCAEYRIIPGDKKFLLTLEKIIDEELKTLKENKTFPKET